MLVGVPGGGQRLECEAAEVGFVAVAQCPVFEGTPASGGGEDGRAVVGGELACAGEEVGVQVGVGGVGHLQPVPVRGGPQCP